MANSETGTSLRKKVLFVSANGHQLSASLELPRYEPVAYAIFAHCFTCSKETLAAFRISNALTNFGIAVLRFDFTGLGSSEGDFANTNFSSNIADIVQAASFLRDNFQAPQIMIGHSLGGAGVLAASADIPEVKAVVTIGAPADTEHLKKLFASQLPEIDEKGEAQVDIAGRKFQIKKQFVDDLKQHRLLDTVAKLDKALLIFHSPKDKIVDFENGLAIFNAASHSKNFISLDHADHLLTRAEDATYVAKVLSAWASRYVATTIKPKAEETAQVIVQETKEGKFTQEVLIGRHILSADEPIANGGNDLGPSPYDFLLAGLGACTSMTLRLYANLKQIPLERVIVKLNHNKEYAQDCENCENPQAKIDKINVGIKLQGNLDAAQREKLLEIANKCPVHRTLVSEIALDTKLIDDQEIK